jgi:hypothetical protein
VRRFALLSALALVVALVAFPLAEAGAQESDPTFAGYVSTFASQPASVSVTFNVPKAKCLNKQGLDGYDTMDVDLVSDSSTSAMDLGITCPSGVTTYAIGIYTGSGSVSSAVTPGEVLTFQATPEAGEIAYSITGEGISPLTIDGPLFSSTSVDMGMTAGSGPFPKFSAWKFSHAVVNGEPLASLDPTGYDQESGSTLQVKTSAITDRGESFDLKYVSQG